MRYDLNHAPESKKLTVKLIKVKGHVDDGNIQVDALAKEGSINGMVIKPHLLLTQNQVILKYNREWIPDISKFIWKKQINNWSQSLAEKSKENFNPPCIFQTSFNFLSADLSPQQKYANWRNLHNAHITSFKKTHLCPHCNCVGSLEHYALKCPNLSEPRQYAKEAITKHLNDWKYPVFGTCNMNLNSYSVQINYRGIVYNDETYFTRHHSIFKSKWSDIQSILSVFMGKAYNQYWKDCTNQ